MLACLLSLTLALLAQAHPAPAQPVAAPPPVALPAAEAGHGEQHAAPAAVPAVPAHPEAQPAQGHVPDAAAVHGALEQAAAEHPVAAHAAAEGHGEAHGEGQGEAHGEAHAEHDTSVAGTIFHHVKDDPAWVKIRPVIGGTTLNLDIGKHAVSMWIAAILLTLTLLFVAGKRSLVPKGIYNFVESLVVFIRDEIAVKNIGEHDGHHYTPYLCTAFFFILFMNLLGLVPIPGIGTATANVNVTVVLASFTFVLTQVAGMKNQGVIGYWAHLVPSGVPAWLYPIMIPVELLGLFTKPFALTIRLFANMLAGHIVIYFLLMLTMILSQLVAPVSIAFALGIYMLEVFVAFVQAYVFTMLSALFIGMASHSH